MDKEKQMSEETLKIKIRRRKYNFNFFIIGLGILLFILGIYNSIIEDLFGFRFHGHLFFIIKSLQLGFTILGSFLVFFGTYNMFVDSGEEKYLKRYSDRLDEIISANSGESENAEKTEALELMAGNLIEIKEFYIWSKRQAKNSFTLAVFMCIFGLILMSTAILFPMVSQQDINVSVISAIGGVIAELIAGTALVVYRYSLSQLNYYHKSLHEDERFLSSINLLDRFSTKEKQDEILQKIIESEIDMNLIELKENVKYKPEKNDETQNKDKSE